MAGDSYNIRFANCEELPLLQDIERAAGELFINTDYPFVATDDPMCYELLYQQYEQGMVGSLPTQIICQLGLQSLYP